MYEPKKKLQIAYISPAGDQWEKGQQNYRKCHLVFS